MKSRRMRWARHEARMGRTEVYTGFWWGILREKDHLEDPGVDGRIILRWIFSKWTVGARTGLIWIKIGKVSGTCECGNEPSGSVKCGEFIDQLRTG
jgi:hypothetical protein